MSPEYCYKIIKELVDQVNEHFRRTGQKIVINVDKEFEKELGVPVIDGVVAAVKILEAIHDYGIKTSKSLTYRLPEKKTILGFPGIFQD
jgi:Asp/Glu/hydantoin racemase